MGCDIHAFSEVKICGEWHFYGELRIDRNYKLFGLIAGVRLDGEMFGPPKGMPVDPTFMTQFICDLWGTDGHNHSWLSSQELTQLAKDHADLWSQSFGQHYLFGNDYQSFYKYPEDYPKALEDFRIVFWFDN